MYQTNIPFSIEMPKKYEQPSFFTLQTPYPFPPSAWPPAGEQASKAPLWVTLAMLICNDLCQPLKLRTRPKQTYLIPGKHPDGVMISDPGIGHSDIRGFGLLLTDRSMVRRERHRLPSWITVSCANSDSFVDRSNLDKTITLSRCFPWLITANLVWIDALMLHSLSSFPR